MTADASMLFLERAKRGDQVAFEGLTEPYRRELRSHCYRMLGSLQEAEDLVQETLLRAWNGVCGFEGHSSIRGWLYKIATNACLNALSARSRFRRILPQAFGPPSEGPPEGGPNMDIPWIEPFPDDALEQVADTAPSPAARYEMKESIQLAFIAAIQMPPPRQRAVLLLRDVLGWPAADVAGLMETSVASVTSALQRARATLDAQLGSAPPPMSRTADSEQRELLERYMRAWESSDLDGFVALLKENATYSMPPFSEWYLGRERIRGFFASIWGSPSYAKLILVSVSVNGAAAFAVYNRGLHEVEAKAHSIQVLGLEGGEVATITLFRDPGLFGRLGLPDSLIRTD